MAPASRPALRTLLLGAVCLGGCLLDEITVPGGQSVIVVSAVMRPDLEFQYVIVERSLDGSFEAPDTTDVPMPPHGPRIPVANALVTVTNLDVPQDACGNPVAFRATPYASGTVAAPGIYWAPGNCPTMRPGDRLALRVETVEGEVVTGVTRLPGMRGAFVALRQDSVPLGGGDSVMTFNRDRDTLRFGVDPVAGRLLQLDVRRDGDLSDYGAKILVDTTEFLLPGNAIDVFASGDGGDIFRGGRSYVVTLTLADTNYFDYSRSAANELTGRGFINRLTGGIGVFGSAVAATSRVWVVADMEDPREGHYRLTGQIGTVPIDADLHVYLHRPTEDSEFSAFLEGAWFTPGPGRRDDPEWVPKQVTRKSVDGRLVAERLHAAISDTLATGFVWHAILDGFFTAADSIPVEVADSSLIGSVPIDTLLAVRQRLP